MTSLASNGKGFASNGTRRENVKIQKCLVQSKQIENQKSRSYRNHSNSKSSPHKELFSRRSGIV